jgi:D-serine deaminase-like pyridoxal phosphate-dependent protein
MFVWMHTDWGFAVFDNAKVQNVYEFKGSDQLLTPALLVYPELVDANIRATLRLMNGDANRWRPHIKTAKIASVIRQMIGHGVRCFKCATTLELLTACEAGVDDVLLAFPVTGANARRTVELTRQFPATRVSVLVESREQLELWIGTEVGIFIDVNPGMNRTGISQERSADILELARNAAAAFRGLHYYDGHAEGAAAQAGYDRLLEIVGTLSVAGCAPGEVITSGTPASQAALGHAGLSAGPFQHRISPGTVVYNDMSSLRQLPGLGYQAAVVVLATVISHPAPGMFTCDAGHKSVSADAGVPTCQVVGHPEYQPMKPSEEHLPMQVDTSGAVPEIGSLIYLLPRHVCPTVNNFDEAVMVAAGEIRGIERVSARGHESGLKPYEIVTK